LPQLVPINKSYMKKGALNQCFVGTCCHGKAYDMSHDNVFHGNQISSKQLKVLRGFDLFIKNHFAKPISINLYGPVDNELILSKVYLIFVNMSNNLTIFYIFRTIRDRYRWSNLFFHIEISQPNQPWNHVINKSRL
jgi:hypothetical protein